MKKLILLGLLFVSTGKAMEPSLTTKASIKAGQEQVATLTEVLKNKEDALRVFMEIGDGPNPGITIRTAEAKNRVKSDLKKAIEDLVSIKTNEVKRLEDLRKAFRDARDVQKGYLKQVHAISGCDDLVGLHLENLVLATFDIEKLTQEIKKIESN